MTLLRKLSGWFFIWLLWLWACQPAPVLEYYLAPGHSFNEDKTFDWSPDQETVKPGHPLHDNAYHRGLIREFIEKELGKKGFVQQVNRPSYQIAYFLEVEDRQAEAPEPGKMGVPELPSGKPKSYPYKKGNLLIRLEETETGKTVWQGRMEGLMEEVPRHTKERIEKAVKRIFSGFPSEKDTKPELEY